MCRHKQKASNKLPAFFSVNEQDKLGKEKGAGGKVLGGPTEA